VLHADVLNRLVRKVVIQVVVGISNVRLNGLGAVEDQRSPLVHVATNEAVEFFESKPGGPTVERTGLTGLPVRDIVILTKPSCVPAIVAENGADARGV
jgi:hypothetical protein